MLDRRRTEASRVLDKAGRIDLRPKWLLFDKKTDTAHDRVSDSEADAIRAIEELGLDPQLWEVVGPIDIGASSAFEWRHPNGEPHLLAIRFEKAGTAEQPQLQVTVELRSGETKSYPASDIDWAIFVGSVSADGG